MAISKIRIKAGTVEIDYEGDDTFLKSDLIKLLKDIQELATKVPPVPSTSTSGTAKAAHNGQQLTTKSIATKLSLRTGPELAEAAVGYLHIMQGKDKFTRDELLAAMKSASGLYKTNMSGNLSKIIEKLLTDDKIVETASGVWAMTPEAETAIRGRLAIG